MERKYYTFEGCGSPEIQGVTIYQGWLSESDVVVFAIGIVTGLRQYYKRASIKVYEEIEGDWHLVRVQE